MGSFMFAFGLVTSRAFAQETDDSETERGTRPPDTAGNELGTADPTVKPAAPTVAVPNLAEDVKTYAGVGSDTSYASLGVAELGGSFALSVSKGGLNISADPTVGYFIVDNIRLAGTLGIRHFSIGDESSNQFSLLVEPSVHLPINDGLFWFGGVGAGVAFLDSSTTDFDAGFALAPRTGVQLLLGRSGILNLGVRYALVFSDVEGVSTEDGLQGETVFAFNNTFDVQAGYTIMF